MKPHTGIRIAVIGAGPRGTSILERLAANHTLSGGERISVVLFDPYGPGGGRIWSGDQPSHLLMNTLCADATHFTDDSVRCAGPVVSGPTLYEWAIDVAGGRVPCGDREAVREAGTMRPWSHPSRRLMGRYLEWCFRRDTAALPATVDVDFVQREVQSVRPGPGGFMVGAAGSTLHFDAVVIATGHSDLEPDAREAGLQRYAAEHRLYYGPPSNPTSQDLDGIAPREKIAVRGLGMNFFDYVSLLTVGRGGEFRDPGNGVLEYLPCGREPVLIAGSRRGVPYRAKGMFGTMTPVFPRRYLTEERVDALAASGRQLDFMRDLWPSIAKDTLLTYYSVLAEHRPQSFAGPLAEVLRALDAHDWGDAGLDESLRTLVPRERDRLELGTVDRPLRRRRFASHGEFAAWWREDLSRDYDEARGGYGSALKCASITLGGGRAAVRRLAPYGGFTGESYARDVEGWYRGFSGALASGPPARRIVELLALIDAGIVVPAGPDMTVTARDGRFMACSPAIPSAVHDCGGLLEAHLPPADGARSRNPLLGQMIREGHARLFEIPGQRAAPLVTGALEVGGEPYEIVNSGGTPQPGLYAVGVPLESIHWGTQLGPLANTNSKFLRETDAVARAAIEHGRLRRRARAEGASSSARPA